MNFSKDSPRMIKTIACLVLFLFITTNLLFILLGHILGIQTKNTLPEGVTLTYLIALVSILSAGGFSLALLGFWVFNVWMKIERSIKGEISAEKEFRKVLKVFKKYPLPHLFIILMYMVIMPITLSILCYVWGRILIK